MGSILRNVSAGRARRGELPRLMAAMVHGRDLVADCGTWLENVTPEPSVIVIPERAGREIEAAVLLRYSICSIPIRRKRRALVEVAGQSPGMWALRWHREKRSRRRRLRLRRRPR